MWFEARSHFQFVKKSGRGFWVIIYPRTVYVLFFVCVQRIPPPQEYRVQGNRAMCILLWLGALLGNPKIICTLRGSR